MSMRNLCLRGREREKQNLEILNERETGRETEAGAPRGRGRAIETEPESQRARETEPRSLRKSARAREPE